MHSYTRNGVGFDTATASVDYQRGYAAAREATNLGELSFVPAERERRIYRYHVDQSAPLPDGEDDPWVRRYTDFGRGWNDAMFEFTQILESRHERVAELPEDEQYILDEMRQVERIRVFSARVGQEPHADE